MCIADGFYSAADLFQGASVASNDHANDLVVWPGIAVVILLEKCSKDQHGGIGFPAWPINRGTKQQIECQATSPSFTTSAIIMVKIDSSRSPLSILYRVIKLSFFM